MSNRLRFVTLLVVVVALLAVPAASAAATCVTAFSNGINDVSPYNDGGNPPAAIAAGPDGNLWFTERGANKIGRITPSGQVTNFSTGISPNAGLGAITAGPDGNLWFTEYNANEIGRITPAGEVTEFSTGISPNAGLSAITAGPDGNLWFTEYSGNRIGRITPAGEVTEFFNGIGTNAYLGEITAGPDGNLWFTEIGAVGRITPAGQVTEFDSEDIGTPYSITAGPGGNLWFSDFGDIGQITPAGKATDFFLPVETYAEGGITAGPDGNLWFTQDGSIGRITPAGQVTEFGISGDDEMQGITAGRDGALWFTEFTSSHRLEIGRITTSGSCPKVMIASRHASVSKKGMTHVTLHCPTGPALCTGTLELTVSVRIKAYYSYWQQETIAHATYEIANDQTYKVTLQLVKNGRKLLRNAKHHRLKVAALAGSSHVALTLKLI